MGQIITAWHTKLIQGRYFSVVSYSAASVEHLEFNTSTRSFWHRTLIVTVSQLVFQHLKS